MLYRAYFSGRIGSLFMMIQYVHSVIRLQRAVVINKIK
jgi:hypothetical protein